MSNTILSSSHAGAIETSGHPLRGSFSQEEPQGTFQGSTIEQAFPSPTPHEESSSALDQALQLLGNPVRAVTTTLPEGLNLLSRTLYDLPKNARAYYFREELEAIHLHKERWLGRQNEYTAHGLERAFSELINAYDAILETKLAPGTYDAMLSKMASLNQAAEAIPRINRPLPTLAEETYELDRPLGLPGAYPISAAAAARDGIHQPEDAIRPYQEPEAVLIPVAHPLRDDHFHQIMAIPGNSKKYRVVEAIPTTSADVEIPADQVFDITPRLVAEIPRTNAEEETL